MEKRTRVVIESPYASADREVVKENVLYARACMRDSILKGENPIASHLLYTQLGILNDRLPEERAIGIECGLQWAACAEIAVFYVDHGWSPGMLAAKERHERDGRPVEIRKLYGGGSL